MQSMNSPYIKMYDEKGFLTNPISEDYKSEYPNRTKRREEMNIPRFKGNNKGVSMTYSPHGTFTKENQNITLKDGSVKIINHYRTK